MPREPMTSPPAQELLDAVRELSFARDLDRLAEVTRAAICRLIGADGAAFVVCEAGVCQFFDEDVIASHWEGRVPASACVAGWVIQHGTPALIPDVALDTRVAREVYGTTSVRSLLVVPVPVAQPAAAISAYWAHTHAATDPEVAALEALADAAARALTNVQTWTDLEQAKEAAAAAARELAGVNRELRRRVAEFETLLDVLPIGIGIARDPGATDIRTNKAFCELLRVAPDANISMSAPESERPTHFRLLMGGREVPPEDLPLQQAAREGREIRNVELDVVFDSGERLRLLENAAPLFDEQGRGRGSIGAFVDITARAEAEEQFRRLADFAPVFVWVSGPDKACTWLNRPWLEFTGLPLEESLGYGWTASVHPDDVDRCVSIYATAFDARQPFEMEYRLRRHDGAYRWMLDIGRPVYESSSTFAGYICGGVDVTERVQSEGQRERLLDAEREARGEAERANRLKDEFLASLSHELRTPLNAILGWTQLLRQMGTSPGFLARGLETLERNARLQTQLIDDLLDMSGILSGKVRLDMQPVNLTRIVEAAVESVQPSADVRGLTIAQRLDGDASLVFGDATRLHQVIWNLLTNAVKFSEPNGRIDVTLERRDGRAVIRVADAGIGIAPEFLPYVFERFRQADSSTTRQHRGLGIGLSIVRHLVELHCGTVHATSDGPGQGATLAVELPLYPQAGASPASSDTDNGAVLSTASKGLSGTRILVVDDDEDSRSLAVMVLADLGAEVVTAGSVTEALDRLRHAPPDVLVTDIGLPGQDEFELIRAVRGFGEAFHDLPALALSAFARPDDRRRAIEAGFETHLSKPVAPADLCAAIAQLVDKRVRQGRATR